MLTPDAAMALTRCRACMLQASEERGAELADELALLNDELTRVRAVAARATVREIAGGGKDDGVVPVKMHLEEASAPAEDTLSCLTQLPPTGPHPQGVLGCLGGS